MVEYQISVKQTAINREITANIFVATFLNLLTFWFDFN